MSDLDVTETGFAWPWLMLALAGLVVAGLVATALRGSWRRTASDPAWVAHSARLRSLPRFGTLVRRRTAFGIALSVAALVACTGAIAVAGRYQHTEVVERSEVDRDIMLCLDASPSMVGIDAEVLAAFGQIVAGLEGERIGLTIWDGVAITVFPLTDDYAFVAEQLRIGASAFAGGSVYAEEFIEYVEGTRIDRQTASQIGDGLVSCVQRFDRADEQRARSVILASDNEPYGDAVYELEQAVDYAVEREVVVHAIAAPFIVERPAAATRFENAALGSGGTYSLLGADGSVDQVVAGIQALEAARTRKPPVVQVQDRPGVGIWIAGLGVTLLVGVWLVQGVAVLAERGGSR